MPDDDLKLLTSKRGLIKATVTRIKTFVDKFNLGENIYQLKTRLPYLQAAFRDFDAVQTEIELQDPTAKQTKEREEFEINYYNLESDIQSLIDKAAASVGTVNTGTSSNQRPHTLNNIRYPELDLPSFYGDYLEWVSFSQTFQTLIHNNEIHSDIEKFHYLKMCIKGDAYKTIQAMTVSEAAYKNAWEILRKRYEHKRLIVQKHVLAILNSPIVPKNSHTLLRQLIDDLMSNLDLLKILEQPVESWDALLVPIIVSKLDFFTKRDWESTLNSDVPLMNDLIKFLERKCFSLESLAVSDPRSINSNQTKGVKNVNNTNNKSRTLVNASVSSKGECYMCKGSHGIYHCTTFLHLSIADRIDKVNSLKLCLNCLKINHEVQRCKARPCRHCNQKHNVLLHETNEQEVADEVSNVGFVVTFANSDNAAQVLLSTAQILVKNAHGQWKKCRALLDVGSQMNFITKFASDGLGLPTNSVDWPITGINAVSSSAQKIIKIQFKSLQGNYTDNIECLVLPKITENLPVMSFSKASFLIPSNISLADPSYNRSDTIDLLLGAETFWKILGTGQIKPTPGNPHLQETCLGWVLGGNIKGTKQIHKPAMCNLSLNALSKQMQKFWEIDEYPTTAEVRYSQEELQCEEFFVNTFKRDGHGRFIVKLPFKTDPSKIGSTRERAMKRFLALENKLARNIELRLNYTQFMDEYQQLHHMELVPYSELSNPSAFYLPHHGVIKESSTTTKLRVVFDASAISSSGVSLNETLMVGPTIQEELFSIILRFRTHQFVLTADINKMYRQILVAPEDRKYQRILWRNRSDEPVKEYQLKTVTYGTSCAPFLAVRCLQQLAVQERSNYPHAYPIIMRDFYVDDVLTGANSIAEIIQMRDELTELLGKGGFILHKWSSNDQSLLPQPNNQNVGDDINMIDLDKGGETKTLGLYWNHRTDQLRYKVVPEKVKIGQSTKRKILSSIAKIYDPLNLVGAVVIIAKLIMQRLWELRLGWDEKLPEDLDNTWCHLVNQLEIVNLIQFPRKVINLYPYSKIELHGFCDASQRAYGACIYIKTVDPKGKCSVQLLCAKSRVAPLKSITVPRLELCGALLLSKLVARTKEILNISFDDIWYWTDSTIVIAWLSSTPNNFKTFVANRIAEIQTLTDSQKWKHVGSTDNPADIISRGILPDKLLGCQLWYHGPSWLKLSNDSWPQSGCSSEMLDIPELRKTSLIAVVKLDTPWINKFSSFNKLQGVIAYCLRFVHNCRNKNNKRINNLTVSELENSTNIILKVVQGLEFAVELSNLKQNKDLTNNSKLKLLHPFLDRAGLIRVGGRLQHSNLSYDRKFPVVLPKHHVTELIIKLEHERHLHAGPLATLSAIRQKYWPLAGRNQVRKIVRKCVRCFRVKPTSLDTLMGSLPSNRFNTTRPFINSGIDYAGPILIKEGKTRSKRTTKAYICLFVCFATKAIHLELVGDLTAASFLGALKRFIARRGMVLNLYSDNATYFVGAQRELNNLLRAQEFNDIVISHLNSIGINWHFIPPRSPHFGGIWEAGIKSAKFHLKRVLGNSFLTFEEMHTLLACVEACLNSRPLCPLSSDPDDLDALTPGHFIIGAPLTAHPEPSTTHILQNRLSRWQYVEQMRQHFWNRWSKEYIVQLQERSRWHKNVPGIKLGDMVLLKEETPPLNWKLGRVSELHPGDDGVTRVVTVKLTNGVTKRAVRKICVLPISDN